MKQALNLAPNDMNALFWLGIDYNSKCGRPDLAFPLINKLVGIDPLFPVNYLALGTHYWLNRENEKALDSFHTDKAFVLIDKIVETGSKDQMYIVFTDWLLFLKFALTGKKIKLWNL